MATQRRIVRVVTVPALAPCFLGPGHLSHRWPFIGDSEEDIQRLVAEYRAGRFPRIGTLEMSP